MKKLLLLFILVLFPLTGLCDLYQNEFVPLKQRRIMYDGAEAFDENHQKYFWSWRAIYETIQSIRNECEKTTPKMFEGLYDWFRENAVYVSFDEIKKQCLNLINKETTTLVDSNGHVGIDRSYKGENGEKRCELPTKTCKKDDRGIMNCGERPFTTLEKKGEYYSDLCDIFLTTLIKKQNEYAHKLRYAITPGTYVERKDLDDGTEAYKILDVILHKDYFSNGDINQDVNKDEDNTGVYLVDNDGDSIRSLNFKTWTNDMFFKVASEMHKPTGNANGVFAESFILPKADCTEDKSCTEHIFELYYKHFGTNSTIKDICMDMPQNTPGLGLIKDCGGAKVGEGDVKVEIGEENGFAPKIYGLEYITKFYNSRDRNILNTRAHATGVKFNGKIAHLEWLGHCLFGMQAGHRIPAPDVAIKGAADFVQTLQNLNKNLDIALAGAAGGSVAGGLIGGIPGMVIGAIVGGVAAIWTPEPSYFKSAWDICGNIAVKDLENADKETFKDRMHRPGDFDAYENAKNKFLSDYGANGVLEASVKCFGKSDAGLQHQDIVACMGKNSDNDFFHRLYFFRELGWAGQPDKYNKQTTKANKKKKNENKRPVEKPTIDKVFDPLEVVLSPETESVTQVELFEFN